MSFFEKLDAAIARSDSLLVVGLDPNPEMLPSRYGQSGRMEGLRDWLLWVIDQTQTHVCAYKPTLGFYEALGAPGFALLGDILQAIPDTIPVILDAKHGDLNTSSALAQTVFDRWQVDAITLNPYCGQDLAAPFLVYLDRAVLVTCCTSNPSARLVQGYPSAERPLYLAIAQEARTWGTPTQLGLEVGTSDPAVLASVRAIAPERLILARSIWQETVDLPQMLAAGLDGEGRGLLLPIPQDWLGQDDVGARVRSLQRQIQQVRSGLAQGSASCQLWMPNVCTFDSHPLQNLILQLFDVGCILFGEFVQASGAVFPYYIDLRTIISNPQLFQQVLNAYAAILQDLTFDRIAGIPYGSLPTATGLALQLNHPMIFPRKEVKAHGTRRLVEGNFNPGETAVVVDDILISGKSAMEGAAKLQSVGLAVQDIVVFLDHEQGVKDRLRQQGYRAHSVLSISEITQTLYQTGRIDEGQFQAFQDSEI
ncbi:bifunctional orotidine-5'-phosphate decarboxylase/orotate phosphoribosyltransferase [Nodosilinea nodulosa]|uniref:bifunctional orotidine-5'-phosphate decarboxylase/orotate phosphoribosyltransferase n=1 Tax=Nodosilinea nodulosa TaxID=416001 RepID=UPI0002FA1E50|nr:bifunctional orotidine-5'-phosphate decarboxylase/orotate phosphoribosyltransferase [Nodosilinea nodulosa]